VILLWLEKYAGYKLKIRLSLLFKFPEPLLKTPDEFMKTIGNPNQTMVPEGRK